MDKLCSKCKIAKPLKEFWVLSRTSGDGLQAKCIVCCKAYQKEWRKSNPRDTKEWFAAHPEKRRKYDTFHRLKKYNLTQEQFDLIFAAQNFRCAICKTDKPLGSGGQWAVDHDHACCPASCRSCGGCVRGILCQLCNQGLGCLRESKKNLKAALTYLESPPAGQALGTISFLLGNPETPDAAQTS